MSPLHLARRLLTASALVLLGGVALSVMTQDAWLIVGHVAGVFSALVAAWAVLLIIAAALRRAARRLERGAERAGPWG